MVVAAGACGIPASARVLALNVTVTGGTAAGFVALRSGGTPPGNTSTVNYAAGQTRGNNAIVTLSGAGELIVRGNQPSGSVHVILDVNGYME